MDKKALVLVSVIAVVVGGGLIYSIAGGSDDPDPVASSVPEAANTADAGSGTQVADQDGSAGKKSGKLTDAGNPGQYVDYSPELVAATPGTKLLFFHAPWCTQCQALESDIEASTIPDDVTIFKVDYDTNQDLRQKYGVTIQTTVVEVDDQGKKVDDVVPYDEPTLSSVEQGLNL